MDDLELNKLAKYFQNIQFVPWEEKWNIYKTLFPIKLSKAYFAVCYILAVKKRKLINTPNENKAWPKWGKYKLQLAVIKEHVNKWENRSHS